MGLEKKPNMFKWHPFKVLQYHYKIIFLLQREIKEGRIINSIFEGSDFVAYNKLISDIYC